MQLVLTLCRRVRGAFGADPPHQLLSQHHITDGGGGHPFDLRHVVDWAVGLAHAGTAACWHGRDWLCP